MHVYILHVIKHKLVSFLNNLVGITVKNALLW